MSALIGEVVLIIWPREVVEANLYVTKQASKSIQVVKVRSNPFCGESDQALKAEVICSKPEVMPQTERPTLHSLGALNFRENGARHVFFAPILPLSDQEL